MISPPQYDRGAPRGKPHDEESHLQLFTVDDPRLWEFRSRLDNREFAIPDMSDEEWETFHSIIAEA